MKESPGRWVKCIKQQIRPPRYLDDEEIKVLKKTAKDFYKDMIEVGLYTGFRIGEVYALQWQDVDFAKNTISIMPKHNWTPKDYEFRTISLP